MPLGVRLRGFAAGAAHCPPTRRRRGGLLRVRGVPPFAAYAGGHDGVERHPDPAVAEHQPGRVGAGRRHRRDDVAREVLAGVHDHLVVLEEHQLAAPRRAGAGRGQLGEPACAASATSTFAQSAAEAWTTKLRVNRPRARPRAAATCVRPSCQPGRGGGQVRPSTERTMPPSSPVRAASSSSLQRGREPAAQRRQRRRPPAPPPYIADSSAILASSRASGRPSAWLGDRRVEVAARAVAATMPRVAGHCREHPRLELAGVGDDQHPARRPRTTAARTARGICSAPPPRRGPAAGDHAAGHVLRPEPAVADPLLAPGPAVRGVQPGQLLVPQQRLDRRMVQPAQVPGSGAATGCAGPVQRAQHLRLGVRVHLRAAEQRGHPFGQPPQPAGRPPCTGRGPSAAAAARRAPRTSQGRPA